MKRDFRLWKILTGTSKPQPEPKHLTFGELARPRPYNRKRLEEAYGRYAPLLVKYGNRHFPKIDKNLIDDFVSDTFVYLANTVKEKGAVQEKALVIGYLYKTFVGLCLNHINRGERTTLLGDGDLDITELPDGILSIEVAVSETQLCEHLIDCLDSLKDNEREEIKFWLEGLTDREIGEILEVSRETVNKRRARIFKKIKSLLKEMEVENELR